MLVLRKRALEGYWEKLNHEEGESESESESERRKKQRKKDESELINLEKTKNCFGRGNEFK